MKKGKRILAMVGVILLVSLYILTLIGAFTASPHSHALFLASIYSTIVIPILIYGYMLIYRLVKKNSDDKKE